MLSIMKVFMKKGTFMKKFQPEVESEGEAGAGLDSLLGRRSALCGSPGFGDYKQNNGEDVVDNHDDDDDDKYRLGFGKEVSSVWKLLMFKIATQA